MNEELRDIKPLAEIPINVTGYVIAMVVCVLLALVLLWLWKRRKPKPKVTRVVPARDYREVLAERIAALEKRDGSDKAFHFELSEIVREFLEKRFDFSATDMTLEQVLTVAKAKVDAPYFSKFERILSASDMVKFANATITRDQGADLLHEFRHLFDELKDPPAEPVGLILK